MGDAWRRILLWAFIVSTGAKKPWMRLVQILLLAAALVSVRPLQDWAFGTPVGQTQAHLDFTRIHNVDELNSALAQAKGKPVMLDLYADWCVACKEFEKYTFSDPQVQSALKETVLLGQTSRPTMSRIRLCLSTLAYSGCQPFYSSMNKGKSSQNSV